MKASAIGLIVCIIIVAFAAACFAGQTRGYQTTDVNLKMALHIKAHNAKQSCSNLPVITELGDMTRTATGAGDYDVFMVLFDYGTGFTGAEFGLSWPAEWGSGTTNHCGDFAIGGIAFPEDIISLTWSACQSSPAFAPITWTWLAATGPGQIIMVYKYRDTPPGPILGIVDCAFQEHLAEYVYFAAVNETPWEGEPYYATEPTTWGNIKSMFR
ncbi:MAG: hypothetical protein PVF95_11450 [bacterium]|jgi:hypothetical protein